MRRFWKEIDKKKNTCEIHIIYGREKYQSDRSCDTDDHNNDSWLIPDICVCGMGVWEYIKKRKMIYGNNNSIGKVIGII